MGFVDAIEEILSLTPPGRQTALFSATMAPAIRRIAQKHLRSPQEITIRSKTTTAANIRQRFWPVSGMHKLDALTRILEVETFDAMLVFARTKQSTVELAERLEARGFSAAALNGDIQQSQRERTVAALKSGKIDILVATDVAARGLDVERISHVVNFDVPYDTESYVHRIGRTGRAGRSGEAILFIAPRERNMLRLIERATRQPIEQMNLPSVDDVNNKRVAKFKTRITEALTSGSLSSYRGMIEEFAQESGADVVDIAAALASLAQGKTPLFLSSKRGADSQGEQGARSERVEQGERPARGDRFERNAAPEAPADSGASRPPRHKIASHRRSDEEQDTYRLEVGRAHGVQAGNIVGAIANEAGLDGSDINGIDIQQDHTFVRLPSGMPPAILKRLQKVRVKGQMLMMTRVEARHASRERPRRDRG
jgi:ATP-dependent RNA helicase DeaD